MTFEKFDVWWAEVPFEEDPAKSKKRPVLILEDETICVIALKMTTHEPRYNKLDGEYELVKWEAAGLSKPTVAQCSKRLKLPVENFSKRIGRLASIDVTSIKYMLSQLGYNKKL